MLCHTAMVGLMSMTPVHMNHSGSSLRVVGIVISLHVAAMYAASPLFGWMADRLGRVPVLAIGASLVVAASGVAGMAPSHDAPQLAAGLALLGFGWSAGLVSGSALLTESVRVEDRPAAQGLSDLVMNVGGAIGGAVSGIVVTAWSYAALGLIVGFTALPLLDRVPLRNAAQARSLGSPGAHHDVPQADGGGVRPGQGRDDRPRPRAVVARWAVPPTRRWRPGSARKEVWIAVCDAFDVPENRR